MPAEFHIAQVNIGLPAVPVDSPGFRDFIENFDPINRQAQFRKGYVWRLFGGSSDGRRVVDAVWPDDPRVIVNLSVWETLDDLRDFVYQGDHAAFMRRRKEFFVSMPEAFQVLWWVPAWTAPTVEEAHARLLHLREHGPTPHSFTFRKVFPAQSAEGSSEGFAIEAGEQR